MAKLTGAFLQLLITHISKSIKTNSPPTSRHRMIHLSHMLCSCSVLRNFSENFPAESTQYNSNDWQHWKMLVHIYAYSIRVYVFTGVHQKHGSWHCNLHFAESCELIMYDSGILIRYKCTNILFKLTILIWDDSNTRAVLVVAPEVVVVIVVVMVVKSWWLWLHFINCTLSSKINASCSNYIGKQPHTSLNLGVK
jgi:hypothetical protein